ncbi:substrate-binding domain-containing protein [Kitasatospora sp. NPDC091257]|uniref:substrate-binding domain-containing protein n=1 Tax=Kitasatospora sp. NPDC091257 TaxID=3364084 RepID=UPI0037F4838F
MSTRQATAHAQSAPDRPSATAAGRFHDTPLCRHLHPGLTSVRLPLRAIATALVGRLLDQVRGRAAPGEGLELPTELVVRGSSGRSGGAERSGWSGWFGEPGRSGRSGEPGRSGRPG